MIQDLKNLELIEKYYENKLGVGEKIDFENRLLWDDEFAEEFRIYKDIVGGIKKQKNLSREELKNKFKEIDIELDKDLKNKKIRECIKNIFNESLEDVFLANKEEEIETETPVETPTKPDAPGRPLKIPIKWPLHLPKPKPKARKNSANNPEQNLFENYMKVLKLSGELKRMKLLISELYRSTNEGMRIDEPEDEAGEPHPSVRRGIEGGKPTAFSDVEYFKGGESGYTTLEKLGSEEYNKIVRDLKEFGQMPQQDVGRTLMMMIELEQPHRRELEQLVLKKVKKQFGLPDEVMEKLEAKLVGMQNISSPDEDGDIEEEIMDDLDFTDEEQTIIKKHVDKRKIQNALMMGGGYRAFSIFNDIKIDLDKIDPRLYPLYSQVMPNVALFMWKFPFEDMMGQAKIMGKSELKETPEGIKAKAQAAIFPILIHEVAKSAIELLFAQYLINLGEQHGEKVYKAVLNKADVFEEEIWMKRIGPILWKYLHDAIDYIVKDNQSDYTIVAYLLNKISLMEPEEFIDLMKDVVYNGQTAINKLNSMLNEIEEEIEDYEKVKGEEPKPEDIETGDTINSKEIEDELISLAKGASQKQSKQKSERPKKNINDMNIDELNIALENAITDEDYELAAKIRDEINKRIS